MDEDVKNSLALDVLVNNEKVNVIQLSGKLNLPLRECSQHLEKWLMSCPEKEREKITREYLVRGEDKEGNLFFRFSPQESLKKLNKGFASFLFSLEKNHHEALSASVYRGGNSSYKRIKLTPQLRKGKVSAFAVPEVVKEPPKEVVVKKEESKAKRENLVTKFFSEKPKEEPKEEVKETKSDSGSDKEAKISPKKPVKADKKSDGKFKGKAAPVGSRSIMSFFNKVPKSAPVASAVPLAPQKTVEEKEEPVKPPEPAKKRPLSEKSPVPDRKSPPKKKKLSRKPKVKAGTSRILQIVDEDSSDSEEERIRREEVEAEDEKQEVMLENEEVLQKTPPRPYKEKKKKTITECYKDEDGYDNVTFKQVDCSSEEE